MGFLVPSSGGSIEPYSPGYVRNPEWITLPDVHATNSEIVGLFAVYDTDTNYVSINVTVVGGYTVDWGDGTTTNHSSGVSAAKLYTYASISSLTQTTGGYRQAIIRVYAQTPANHFSVVNFQVRPSIFGAAVTIPWLDINVRTTATCTSLIYHQLSPNINMAACERFNWVGTTAMTSMNRNFWNTNGLKYLNLPNFTACTNWNDAIGSSSNLIECYIGTLSTASNTTFVSTFSGCQSLRKVGLFNTAKGTDFTSMFSSCYSLMDVPEFVFTSATSLSSMFLGCNSLRTENLPAFSFPAATNASSMFSGCTSLVDLPAMSFPLVTSFTSFLSSCTSLRRVGLINTPSATNMSTMFQNCYSLIEVALFNTGSVTNFTSMFQSCFALTGVPLFNTASGTNFTSMFNNCYSLRTIPLFNTAAATNITSMFNGSYIHYIPAFNFSSVTTASTWISNCYNLEFINAITFGAGVTPGTTSTNMLSLQKISGTNFIMSLDFFSSSGGKKLNKAALEEMWNNINLPGTGTHNVTNTLAAASLPFTKTCTTTAGSPIVLCAATSSVAADQQMTGTGSPITTAIAVSFTDAGDLVNLVAHGLSNGRKVYFPSVVTTTGITVNREYFIVNANTDDFQISLTLGGSPITLTNNGTGTLKYMCLVVSTVANTSITFDTPMTSSGTNTMTFRALRTGYATLKGLTVTG